MAFRSESVASYESMGPSLLAAQPPTLPEAMPRPDEDWETVFAHLESRMGMLRTWRWSWMAHWSRLAEYFLPRRCPWWSGWVTANRMNKGSPLNDAIIDSTATLALRTCSSGMWSGITNPARPWLALGIGLPWITPEADAKEWLEDTSERILTVMGQSNFYTKMAQAFEDLTLFGTAPLIIYEDAQDTIRLYLPTAGEYFLAVGARLERDTLYREYSWTVAQIVEQFTLEACPPEVRKLWAAGGGSLEQEFVVAHAIEPNFALQGRGRNPRVTVVPGRFIFREVYWLRGCKSTKPLSKLGFHSKPFIAMVWSEVSNDAYGRSPCMDALGDTKQIQQETKRKGEFIDKGVRPPMGADPALKNEPSSILPGHVTFFNTENGKKGFFPLFEPNAGWMGPLTADIKEVSQRIDKCLFVDVFMAISQMEGVQPRNELELTKRDLERLQKLGPVINLVLGEISLAVQRIMDIMQRKNMLKPMPKSLHGLPLKIDFVTIQRLAQKSATSVAMKDVFTTMGALSSAAQAAHVPDPIRVLNLDESARKYAEINNYPSTGIFTPDEVQAHDDAREHAQGMAQAPNAAMAAVNAAKTLSQTSLDQGNAFGAMMGGGAPGA